MASSTEQTQTTPDPHRRKHQWIGAATLVASAALVLPWFLTPRFESIRRKRLTHAAPILRAIASESSTTLHDQETLTASRDKLDALMSAPVRDESQASFIIQVGAFKNRDNAKALQTKLEVLDVGRVYLRTEESLTRVYVGPLLDRSTAEAPQGQFRRSYR